MVRCSRRSSNCCTERTSARSCTAARICTIASSGAALEKDTDTRRCTERSKVTVQGDAVCGNISCGIRSDGWSNRRHRLRRCRKHHLIAISSANPSSYRSTIVPGTRRCSNRRTKCTCRHFDLRTNILNRIVTCCSTALKRYRDTSSTAQVSKITVQSNTICSNIRSGIGSNRW